MAETLRCYQCDAPEDEEKLFFCGQCEPSSRKLFCLDCGAPNHKRMDHTIDDNNFKPAHFQMDEQTLDAIKNESKEKLELAITSYLIDGTQKALATVHKVASSASGGFGAAIGSAVATEVLTNGTKEIVKAGAKGVLQCSGIITAGLFVCEAIYLGVQWYRNKIDDKELGRRLCKSAVRNGASLGSAVGGAAMGAMICGPVGAFIGAILGGIGGSVSADYFFEKYWPDDDQKLREKQIAAAIKQFGIDRNRLKDRGHFNRQIIDKKYKVFSKMFHPDRPGGNRAAFEELAINYGLLIAILDGDQKTQKNAEKMVLALKLHE